MNKTIGIVGMTCALALGCATMNNGDDVREAALHFVGSEQIAWLRNEKPAGMESVIALTNMNAHVDSITLSSPREATAIATYKYTGRFSTEQGERTGTLTIRRKLHFTKTGSEWKQSGTPEEIARRNNWSSAAA